MVHLSQSVSHPFKNFHFVYPDLYTLEVLQVSQVQVYLLEFEMVLHTLSDNHSHGEPGFPFELVQQQVYKEVQTFNVWTHFKFVDEHPSTLGYLYHSLHTKDR